MGGGGGRKGGRTNRSFPFRKSSVFSLKRIPRNIHLKNRRSCERVRKGILGPASPPTSRKAPRSQIDLKRQYLHPLLSWTHLKWITADELSGPVFLTVYLHFKTGLTQLFLLFGQLLLRSRKVCSTAETLSECFSSLFPIFTPKK